MRQGFVRNDPIDALAIIYRGCKLSVKAPQCLQRYHRWESSLRGYRYRTNKNRLLDSESPVVSRNVLDPLAPIIDIVC